MGAEQPPHADLTNERLVERCREGVDEAAFAALVVVAKAAVPAAEPAQDGTAA